MEALSSIALTVREAREKIINGTIYSNVSDVIQQFNQMVRVLNGSTFTTGGLATMPLREWTFDLPQLGTTLLNIDANYVESMTPTLDMLTEFVIAVCETELLVDNNRNGAYPQSEALRLLSNNKYVFLNMDLGSKYISEWHYRLSARDPTFSNHVPYIFPYDMAIAYDRVTAAYDNVSGTRFASLNNAIHFAAFDQDFVRGQPANARQFEYLYNLRTPVSNATIVIHPMSDILSVPSMIRNQAATHYWPYNPYNIPTFRDDIRVEFQLAGQVIYVAANLGMHTIPQFDAVNIILTMRRLPLLADLQNIFPAGNPSATHQAVISTKIEVLNATTETTVPSIDEHLYALIVGTRGRYQMQAGPVFPPGMRWDDILNRYTPARQSNMQRLMTTASILDLVSM
uniref:Inner capsid protein n=7 Tax=Rotavirus D TaxID=335100 RepID=A0A067XKX7_9REOV|nr:inner capsid protein [Rotavirus D RVD/Avian/India/UKD48/2012]